MEAKPVKNASSLLWFSGHGELENERISISVYTLAVSSQSLASSKKSHSRAWKEMIAVLNDLSSIIGPKCRVAMSLHDQTQVLKAHDDKKKDLRGP